VAGHLCAPTASFSYRHLPSSASDQILSEPFRLIVWRFISMFLLCFPLYFIFVCSSCFLVLVFPCIVFSLFVLCVFYFCSSVDLLCISFAALHLLSGLYYAPPCDELQIHLSLVEISLNAIGFSLYFLFACICFFPCISVLFLLVIMLSPHWFGWIPFGPDLCCGCVCYPSFRVEEEEWSRLPCRG
jgi:hypothetical protein